MLTKASKVPRILDINICLQLVVYVLCVGSGME